MITIREFTVAMETFGAERLPDTEGTRYKVLVPCFCVKGVIFLHSGSYYISKSGDGVPKEIMNWAMTECGEKHPGGSNFWWGEIHSIRGMLTLVAMLEGKYTKEFVDELTNEAYKKLLDCQLIRKNEEILFKGTQSPKMQKLCEVLAEYNDTVNLFGSYQTREPIGYLDKVRVQLSAKDDGDDQFASLSLYSKSTETHFNTDKEGWSYSSFVVTQKERKNRLIHLCHYYQDGKSGENADEVIYLDYSSINKKRKHMYKKRPKDIDLRISVKTGLAWETYKEKQALPATDEQIDIMISYLKVGIRRIKKTIIRNMVEKGE